jgi:hypothetical protein
MVLLVGIGYGLAFVGLLFVLSSGMMGDDVDWDLNLSKTFLDTGQPCVDNTGAVWLKAWVAGEDEKVHIRAYNVPRGDSINITWSFAGEQYHVENKTATSFSYVRLAQGDYSLKMKIYNTTDLGNNSPTDSRLYVDEKMVDLSVSTEESNFAFLPWVDEGRSASIEDNGPRACFTRQQLGGWGWGLMVAEWLGGRETAMLTGGNVGVPAWWMAFVSLSMSAFFLFIQYPLMYRFYHRESDDILSEEQTERLVRNCLEQSEKQLNIDIHWNHGESIFKMQERDISIDVLVPYDETANTMANENEVRSELIKDILEEFRIFGVLKPLQLKAKQSHESKGMGIFEKFSSLTGSRAKKEVEDSVQSLDADNLVDDYTKFFSDVGTLSGIEDRVHASLSKFLRQENLTERHSVVGNDENLIFVRVIYKPTKKFAFLSFRETYVDVQKQIHEHLEKDLQNLLGDLKLVVWARNEVSTLADRTAAGRVEHGKGDRDSNQEALVASQECIAGRVLQTQLMGDILSTVEFVAAEKREFINKWGFWGLMVFVWIPFMASGVLVGAMLGLLARMNFWRVLFACSIGGAVASVTWAYTAEGIIELMHRLNAELFIPLLIIVIVGMALLHLRTNKARRRKELFDESMAFFGTDLAEEPTT